jgi:hypothetical protein
VSFHWLEGEALLAARGSSHPVPSLARALLRPPSGPRAAAVWAAGDPVASVAFGADLVAGIARRRLGRPS